MTNEASAGANPAGQGQGADTKRELVAELAAIHAALPEQDIRLLMRIGVLLQAMPGLGGLLADVFADSASPAPRVFDWPPTAVAGMRRALGLPENPAGAGEPIQGGAAESPFQGVVDDLVTAFIARLRPGAEPPSDLVLADRLGRVAGELAAVAAAGTDPCELLVLALIAREGVPVARARLGA